MSHIGRRGGLAVGFETSAGSGETSYYYTIPYLTCDLDDVYTPLSDKAVKAMRISEGGDSVMGKKSGEGAIEVAFDPETAPIWFALALGSIQSTTVGALYIGKHTITINEDNEPKTAVFYLDRVVEKRKFSYGVVKTLEMSFDDDIAKLKMEVLSRASDTASESLIYEELKIYTFGNASVILTNAGSTSEIKVNKFSLKINNNSEAKWAPNSLNVDRIINKNITVDGKMVLDFETTTQKEAFRNLTKQKVEVVFTGQTSKTIITIPQFRVEKYKGNYPADDIMTEEIDFVAEYDGSKLIDVVIENETAFYL